jgi:predicted RNA binding protein YcfA (HicA-like mRNA interferase family)
LGRLKVLSGADVCKILQSHGFEQVRQKGSHVIMQKSVATSTVTVPVPIADVPKTPVCRAQGKSPGNATIFAHFLGGSGSSLILRQRIASPLRVVSVLPC